MTLLKSIDLRIAKKLQDSEYRIAFFEEWANDEVADQIRRLRKLRKLRQIDVAKETGMLQSAISRLEQSEYSRWNFSTLLRIAQSLDARVRVIFEPSEHVIRHYELLESVKAHTNAANVARETELQKAQANVAQDGSRNLVPRRELIARVGQVKSRQSTPFITTLRSPAGLRG